MQNTLNTELLCSAQNLSMQIDSVYKDQSDSVYYQILLKVDSQQFTFGRRYNEFHEFDKTLKYHFPTVSFPGLPSKFTLFNKVELRKKGFNSYLEELVGLLKLFTIDQKVMFLKLLIEFLDSQVRKSSFGDLDLKKSSKLNVSDLLATPESSWNYQGWGKVKLDLDWVKFYLYVKDDLLFLHDDMEKSDFRYVISLLAGKILSGKDNIIELYHENHDFPIYFDSQDNTELKKILVIACSSTKKSPLTQTGNQCVGRISIRIHSANYIRYPKPPTSMIKPYLYILVEYDIFSFKTSIQPLSDELSFSQTFIVPVFNVFFDIKFSVCIVTSEGWIKQHAKTEILNSVRIPVTDINQPPFCLGTIVVYLDKGKTDKKNKDEELGNIVLDIKKHSAFFSHFVPPSMHYIEDTPLPDQASMHDLKIAFRRMKRIRILYFRLLKTAVQAFYFIYPQFSMACLLVYSFFVLFVPFSLFLPLLLLLILFLALYLNPDHDIGLRKLRKFFFSKKKHVAPYPKVITIKESIHRKKAEMKVMKEKVKEGVIKRWKKFKLDAVELQNYLTIIACYGEKLRNLLLWEDPEKTYIFCFILALLIIFLILIPFRAILFFAGLDRFYKGYSFTQKRIESNKKVSEEVLNSLLAQFLSNRLIKANSNDFWPKELKDTPNLQKKIVEGIRLKLGLDVSTEMFEKCKSPAELTQYLSSAIVLLKRKDNKNESMSDLNFNNQKSLFWGFLTNVPSEYYRLEHPRVQNIESYY